MCTRVCVMNWGNKRKRYTSCLLSFAAQRRRQAALDGWMEKEERSPQPSALILVCVCVCVCVCVWSQRTGDCDVAYTNKCQRATETLKLYYNVKSQEQENTHTHTLIMYIVNIHIIASMLWVCVCETWRPHKWASIKRSARKLLPTNYR